MNCLKEEFFTNALVGNGAIFYLKAPYWPNCLVLFILFVIRSACFSHWTTCNTSRAQDNQSLNYQCDHLYVLCFTWVTLIRWCNLSREWMVYVFCVWEMYTHAHTRQWLKPHPPICFVFHLSYTLSDNLSREWMGAVHAVTVMTQATPHLFLLCFTWVINLSKGNNLFVWGFCPHFHINDSATSKHPQYSRNVSVIPYNCINCFTSVHLGC